jgi:hypothetical protein
VLQSASVTGQTSASTSIVPYSLFAATSGHQNEPMKPDFS